MLDRDAYCFIESEFLRTSRQLEIEAEDAKQAATDILGPKDDAQDFMDALHDLNCDPSPLETAVLAYAPIVKPTSPAHVISGIAHAYGATDSRVGVNTYPISAAVSKHLNINASRAVGLSRLLRQAQGFDADTVKWDLLTLAEIITYTSDQGPRFLTETYGIQHFGRYPVETLVDQIENPEFTDTEREVPIYNSSFDDNNAFWVDPLTENVIDLSRYEGSTLRPRIYEFTNAAELTQAMQQSHNPAFGIINAHGNRGYFSIGYDSIYAQDLDAGEGIEIGQRWSNAAGIVITSCNAAQPSYHGQPSLIEKLADYSGMPVVGSEGDVRNVVLTRTRRVGKTIITVTIDDNIGGVTCLSSPTIPVRNERDFQFDV